MIDIQKRGLILLVDGSAGVFVPQRFARLFNMSEWQGVSEEDAAALKAGPNAGFGGLKECAPNMYWETWDDVLANASYTEPDNGKVWRLHQDGDLWAYCEADMSEADKLEFFGA